MTTSTATSVVLFDELPDAVLRPDVEGVAGADGRDLLVEDLVVRPVEEAVDTGLGAGLKEEGSGAGFDILTCCIWVAAHLGRAKGSSPAVAHDLVLILTVGVGE